MLIAAVITPYNKQKTTTKSTYTNKKNTRIYIHEHKNDAIFFEICFSVAYVLGYTPLLSFVPFLTRAYALLSPLNPIFC